MHLAVSAKGRRAYHKCKKGFPDAVSAKSALREKDDYLKSIVAPEHRRYRPLILKDVQHVGHVL